jgi:hypothetical protein
MMNDANVPSHSPQQSDLPPGPPCPPDLAENEEHPPASNKSGAAPHTRKCRTRHYPERDEIEQRYFDWADSAAIAREYKIPEWLLYRHIYARGLVSRRRESLRVILDRVLERGVEAPIAGNTIIRAVRAQPRLTDDNRRLEPTHNMIYTQVTGKEAPPARILIATARN